MLLFLVCTLPTIVLVCGVLFKLFTTVVSTNKGFCAVLISTSFLFSAEADCGIFSFSIG
jgi:hypothetical protein